MRRAGTRTTDNDSAGSLERLSHPERVYFPEADVTKRDLADYYLAVAPWMLPELAGRPITIVRCPNGMHGPRFFQKHPSAGTLRGLARVTIREKDGSQPYAVVRRASDLVELAQIGALEIHVWGSQASALEKPDRLVFDLDPGPGVKWEQIVHGARQIRDLLGELGLVSFTKTSGGKGLHVVVPIARRHAWPRVTEFSRDLAYAVARAAPDRFVATMAKEARRGKIFVDYLRNQRGATTVAAYSTRAKPLAAVSMPIDWDALGRIEGADHFRLSNARRHIGHRRRDPWAEIRTVRQSLTSVMHLRVRAMLR